MGAALTWLLLRCFLVGRGVGTLIIKSSWEREDEDSWPQRTCAVARIESDLVFKQFPPIHEQRIGQILRKSHFFQCCKSLHMLLQEKCSIQSFLK